ncbi:undecaprenyl-phosphate galactose phosphotransferase [Desulforhopalus singaporensis]|uniref:Undecaprenyl-phosphate galactose phosphotransferase n=2 Tax=Desulforhopalus singaporensis TaxID=91360 RepID=A0A1H0QLC3_9BACT|nr:undecaprenyl-phosphate galactose phosphotransferase [Desulforhopalus singaporensis]
MLSMNLREQSSLMARLLHLFDCFLCIGYLWTVVVWYRVPWNEYYTRLVVITFVLTFVSFQSFQLYRSWRGWKFFREFLVILKAWGTVIGLLLFYFFIFKISVAYSRLVILVWSITTPILIFLLHIGARKILRLLRSKGKNVRRAIVVGAGELGVNLVREVETMPWAGIKVMGFFDDKVDEHIITEVEGKPLLGNIGSINEYLKVHEIDYIYIALPMRAEKKIFKILRECRSLGARIFLIPDLYLYGLHHAEIQSLGSMLILNFNPNTEWKRSFDVVFSLMALVATLPVTLVIALLVKLSDGGPVFYKHQRITAAGKKFNCLKFRTMRVGADRELQKILATDEEMRREWQQSYKLKSDPRVTGIGKILRRTSLDELPQFLNVLRGDMSVVGARPIVDNELNGYYKESAGRYCSMKPGITGPWQVGRRSNVEDYGERVQMDDWYILNYSLWTDIKIIIKTVYCMVKGNGAY